MIVSGGQNGGLAKILAGVHGWPGRGGSEGGSVHNSKAPSSMPVHKSKGVAKSWGLGLGGGWGVRRRAFLCLSEELLPLLDTPSDPSYLGVGEFSRLPYHPLAKPQLSPKAI